ncbi:MAG: hypothetical protein WCA63_00650 [Gallionella sp.]
MFILIYSMLRDNSNFIRIAERCAMKKCISLFAFIIIIYLNGCATANKEVPIASHGNLLDLGNLGGSLARATAISSNGSVIVGDTFYSSTFGRGTFHIFRWSQSGGVQDLGTFGGQDAHAAAVSADGSVIVGNIKFGNDKAPVDHIFRWNETGGVKDLGTFGGQSAFAKGVSADGKVIIGTIQDTDDSGAIVTHAFRWSEATGVQYLVAPHGQRTEALGVSADGTVVVGSVGPSGLTGHAFRWADADGFKDLGALGGQYSEATTVSADGSVVAGWVSFDKNKTSELHVFVWKNTEGFKDLGIPGLALSISADGSVVVGNYSIKPYNSSVRLADQPLHGFRWAISSGLDEIGNIGGIPLSAVAVSGDGTIVVGNYGAGFGYTTNGVFVASYRKDNHI